MVTADKNEITIVRSGGVQSSARISRENYQNIFCNLLVHHFKRLQINHSSIYGLIILEMDFNLRAEPKQKTDIPPQPHRWDKRRTIAVHLWYNCRALAVTAIAVHRTIATAIVRRLDYG